MTAVPDIHSFPHGAGSGDQALQARPYHLDEAYWGFAIRNSRRASIGLMLVQAASLVIGLAFGVAAVGIWVMPSGTAAQTLTLFKLGASIPAAAAAVLLLWFANRGTIVDIEVDTNQGELREVLRNPAGRSTVLSVYGFDAIGGVFLQRDVRDQGRGGHARLVLRYRNTAQVLLIAEGPEVMLELLRDRLGRDLMVKRGGAGWVAAVATHGDDKAA